jgi:hypothetical protein
MEETSMMTPAELRAALDEMTIVKATDDGLRVSTLCLYPSNGAVTLSVRGSGDSFVVSDDGGAVDTLLGSGRDQPLCDHQVNTIIGNQGLRIENGAIYCPAVTRAEVPVAIALVANTAKMVAEWGHDNVSPTMPRDFKHNLAQLLQRHFKTSLEADCHIHGASTRAYSFDHVVHLHGGRRLLIDPVLSDATSINAALAANLDVSRLGDPGIIQRIVYDDARPWQAADLSLLAIAAPTVPFSTFEACVLDLARAA